MDCRYRLENDEPKPVVFWEPSEQFAQLYMKPSPYTKWTIEVLKGDVTNVTKIRPVFWFSYLRL